jgi:hypothetical protein
MTLNDVMSLLLLSLLVLMGGEGGLAIGHHFWSGFESTCWFLGAAFGSFVALLVFRAFKRLV